MLCRTYLNKCVKMTVHVMASFAQKPISYVCALAPILVPSARPGSGDLVAPGSSDVWQPNDPIGPLTSPCVSRTAYDRRQLAPMPRYSTCW